MAKPSQRMRLKDKIVDDVSKAIKGIQEQLYFISKDPSVCSSPPKRQLTLSNGDRLSHKLCDKLDHAFLHGLREVTHGYWRLVKTLSHKGMVREIDLLTNVTTDLGRGRAWLYVSLNEGLLESYFRMLTENEKLVKKHYNKEALLLDRDRMNVLLTLTSGLDFVTFHLEYDLPYLDLSPSPPRTQTFSFDEDSGVNVRRLGQVDGGTCPPCDSDSVSVTSFDAQSPADVKAARMTPTSIVKGGAISFTTAGVSNNGDAKEPLPTRSIRAVTPTEIYPPSNNNFRNRTPSDSQSLSSHGSTCDLDRHQRFESIISVDKELIDDAESSLEVIRIKKKKKKKPSKPSAINSDSLSQDNVKNSTADSTTGPISDKLKDTTSQHVTPSLANAPPLVNSASVSHSQVTERSEKDAPVAYLLQLDSGIGIDDITAERNDVSLVDVDSYSGCDSNKKRQQEENGDYLFNHQHMSLSNEFDSLKEKSFQSVIESKIAELCNVGGADESDSLFNSKLSNHVMQNFKELDIDSCVKDSTDSQSETVKVKPEELLSGDFTSDASHLPKSDQSPSVYDNRGQSNMDRVKGESPSPDNESRSLPEGEPEDYYDVYSTSSSSTSESMRSKKDNSPILTKLQEASYMQDYMDCVLKGSDLPDQDALTVQHKAEPEDYSLSLDNNIKLQVMLDIFKQEDETFIKMFACRENHTEGHFTVSFVLISDHYLYLLHYQTLNRKFIVQSVTKLTDIIFISTGLYEQTLNIESRDKSRQKQRLWLTPGHQELTKAIVQSLTEVVKQANATIVSVRARFSVGSDVPLQKIGLRKYISKELHCEAQDVVIQDYSLVFWEDPSSSESAYSDPTTREGTLLLRTQDPIKGFIWKPVFVALKGTMLSVSNSRNDPSPHSYLGLGGDQCIGCRQTEVGERQHCVELVLATGGSWYLSAATAAEILDWRRALCLAVSRGVEEMGALSACVPCCCVQSCGQLMLCHEDLDTKFFRTLGRAQLEDVTALSVDKDGPPYCVVEFESQEVGVTSGKWVFHFASTADMSRFISSLATSWRETFQVDLPVLPLEDVSLQRHCQSHAALLAKAFDLT